MKFQDISISLYHGGQRAAKQASNLFYGMCFGMTVRIHSDTPLLYPWQILVESPKHFNIDGAEKAIFLFSPSISLWRSCVQNLTLMSDFDVPVERRLFCSWSRRQWGADTDCSLCREGKDAIAHLKSILSCLWFHRVVLCGYSHFLTFQEMGMRVHHYRYVAWVLLHAG